MNNQIARGASAKKSARAHRASKPPPFIEPPESRTLLAAGALDQTFGHHGILHLTAQRPDELQTVAAAALPNGKTVILGRQPAPNPDLPPFTLARLNADGSPDLSFGTDGILAEPRH